MFAVLPQIDVPGYEAVNYDDAPTVSEEYTSRGERLLSKEETVEMIEAADVVSV